MRCLFKAIFVLKAVNFVACDFLDSLELRKPGVVKKVEDFLDRDLTAISSKELVAVPRYREPVCYPCVCLGPPPPKHGKALGINLLIDIFRFKPQFNSNPCMSALELTQATCPR